METIAGVSSELPERLAVVIDGGRASKKLITDTQDKELPSSGHLVLSNDDLLIEILLRSPSISIILWKTVSKRWLSLITTPTFALRRSQIPNRDPPSGLILRRGTIVSMKYDFVPLDIRVPASSSPSKINITPGSAADNVQIFQSCNGLLLCCIGTDHDKMVYVCNPSLNLFKMLPKENCYPNIRHIRVIMLDYAIGGFKMAFDPTKSPHYTVIHATVIEPDGRFVHIQTYSSETCNWSVCGVRFRPEYFSGFFSGVYWNGAICWLCSWDQVSHLKLNLQHPVLTTIKTPKDRFPNCRDRLFESRGRLLLVCNAYNHTKPSNIYEMRNDCCEWLWMYRFDINNDIARRLKSINRWRFCVRAIVLGEREDESFIVIEKDEKILKYNLALKTLSHLFDWHRTRSTDSSCDGIPFITSFAGV